MSVFFIAGAFVLVFVSVVAYTLHKSGKTVTGATVVAAAEADVKADAAKVASKVASKM